MSLKVHPNRNTVMSNGTPLISSVFNRLVSPSRKEGTLFKLYFIPSLLSQVFIRFSESYSHCLLADMTQHNTAGWAVLYHLLNVIFDKDVKENNLPRFPYQEGTVGKWFQQALSKGRKPRTINMLNLRMRPRPNEYPRLNVQSVFPPSEEETTGYTMLYHGTSHHGNAKSILEGIKLTESKGNGDFSCGRGFYLTNRFERAVEYAFPNLAAKAAVLGFKIPNDKLDRFRRMSINLVGKENKGKWLYVVRNISSISKRGDISFIEGPEMRRVKGKKIFEQLPNSHQMCILDEDMAETFDRYLYSVVFYNTTKD